MPLHSKRAATNAPSGRRVRLLPNHLWRVERIRASTASIQVRGRGWGRVGRPGRRRSRVSGPASRAARAAGCESSSVPAAVSAAHASASSSTRVSSGRLRTAAHRLGRRHDRRQRDLRALARAPHSSTHHHRRDPPRRWLRRGSRKWPRCKQGAQLTFPMSRVLHLQLAGRCDVTRPLCARSGSGPLVWLHSPLVTCAARSPGPTCALDQHQAARQQPREQHHRP
jgi:hypothetical protein